VVEKRRRETEDEANRMNGWRSSSKVAHKYCGASIAVS
jgi:hypothetical protein